MSIWSALISPVTGIVTSLIEGHQRKRELKQQIHLKKLERIQAGHVAEVAWNNKVQDGAGRSWKDEWLTLLLSIPLVGAFFPSMVPYIREGFEVLDTMPDWYKAAIAVMIAATFGYRKYADWQMSKHYTLPDPMDKIDQ